MADTMPIEEWIDDVEFVEGRTVYAVFYCPCYKDIGASLQAIHKSLPDARKKAAKLVATFDGHKETDLAHMLIEQYELES